MRNLARKIGVRRWGEWMFYPFHLLPAGPTKNRVRRMFVRHNLVKLEAQFVNRGDTVVIVGTPFVERISALARLTAAGGRGVIFEPEESNYEQLSTAAKGHPNVEVHRYGVWSESGELQLQVARDDRPGDHKLPTDGVKHDNEYRSNNYVATQQVDVDTLDNLLRTFDVSPDYVEIDVSGAEMKVLRGAERVLTEDKPRFWVGGHARDESGQPLNKRIIGHLMSLGYETELTSPRKTDIEEIEERPGDVYAWHQNTL